MQPEISLHITTIKPLPFKPIDLQGLFTSLGSQLFPRQYP
jgi:hypothetical protein